MSSLIKLVKQQMTYSNGNFVPFFTFFNPKTLNAGLCDKRRETNEERLIMKSESFL